MYTVDKYRPCFVRGIEPPEHRHNPPQNSRFWRNIFSHDLFALASHLTLTYFLPQEAEDNLLVFYQDILGQNGTPEVQIQLMDQMGNIHHWV